MKFSFNRYHPKSMIKPFRSLLVSSLLVSTFVLSACSSMPVEPSKPTYQLTDAPLITDYDSMAAAYQDIILGRMAVGQQDYEIALEHYLSALKVTDDLSLIREAIGIAEQLQQEQVSYQLAERWLEHEPDEGLAIQLLAYYALKFEDTAKAQSMLKQLLASETEDARLELYLSRMSGLNNAAFVAEQFSVVAKSEPNNKVLLLALVKLNERLGDDHKALTAIDQLLFNHPDYLSAYLLKGQLLKDTKQYQKAKDWYLHSLKKYPDNTALLYDLGHLYYQQDQFQQARDYFNQLLALDNQNQEARYMLAASFYAEGLLEPAKEQFIPLLRISRHRPTVFFYLGEIAREQDNFQEAIKYYLSVTQGQFFERANLLAARLMAEQDDYQAALSHLEALKQKTPNKEQQLTFDLTRIQLLVNKQDYQQAQALVESINANEPKATQAQLSLALTVMLQRAKQLLLAMDSIEQAIFKHPNNLDMHYTQAMLAAELEDFEQTEQSLRTILTIDPQHIDAMNALGYTLVDNKKQLAEAEQLINKAYAAQPNSPAIIDSMGWLKYRQGDLVSAKGYLLKAYQLEPSDEISAHLVEVLWALGEKQQAQRILDKTLSEFPDSRYLDKLLKRIESNELNNDE